MTDVKIRTEETEGKAPQKCGETCEIWSRCCGYFRPVSAWNIGKKQEFQERKMFNVKNAR